MIDPETLAAMHANILRLQAENVRLRRENKRLLENHEQRVAQVELTLGMRMGPRDYVMATRTEFSLS